MTDKYKTSKRIRFASDNWGGQDKTHVELEWHGRALMIDITDDLIHIVGLFFKSNQHSVNALDITPEYPG